MHEGVGVLARELGLQRRGVRVDGYVVRMALGMSDGLSMECRWVAE